MSKLLSKAIEYASLDYSVIPVGRDKRPLLAKWKQFQETAAGEEQIEKWWDKPTPPNIGIVTGRVSGIIVIDIDTHKGAVDIFPETYTVQTGNGGLQKYYRYVPGFTVSANGYPHMPHVDIRADGGYVVAPPSVTNYKTKEGKQMGGEYTLIHDIPLAPFPTHLFASSSKQPYKSPSIDKVLKGFDEMAEGDGRNNALTKVVGKILKLCAPKDFESVAWPMTLAANARFKKPLDEDEVRVIFNSISKKEKVKPLAEVEFLCTDKGMVIVNVENVYRTLINDPALANCFRTNTFAGTIETTYDRKEWTPIQKVDIIKIQSYLMTEYPHFTKVPPEMVEGAILHMVEDTQVSPPVEWLESLVWDKKPRIDSWLTSTYGVTENAYHKAVGANWLKGLVKRLTSPGSKFDYVLVLEGKQGIRKSTSLAILGGAWHVETVISPTEKDFFMLFANNMIVEFSEGETLSRTEAKHLKAVITMQFDKYRPPYDRSVKTFPRQCVFAMTTNQDQYLKDETGNRRWLPVACKQVIDTDWLTENRDQLFAEAYYRVTALHETTYEFPAAETEFEQNLRQVGDPQEDIIFEWYYNVLTDAERSKGITVRMAYLGAIHGGFGGGRPMEKRDEMTLSNILLNSLKLEKNRSMIKGTRGYVYLPTKESEANKPDAVVSKDTAIPTTKAMRYRKDE